MILLRVSFFINDFLIITRYYVSKVIYKKLIGLEVVWVDKEDYCNIINPKSPFVTSGLRIGTAAVTSRGFKEEEMKLIAKWIKAIIVDFENSKETVNAEVMALCEKFPIY